MKTVFFMLSIVCMVLISHFSFAQNSILAGKITDENGKPVAGAIIKITKDWKSLETRSDNGGLYYSQLLPAGNYYVDIYSAGACYKAKKVYVNSDTKTKKYYNFKLIERRAVLTEDDRDPFMAASFDKIDIKQKNVDYPVGSLRRVSLKTDSMTGNLSPEWQRTERDSHER